MLSWLLVGGAFGAVAAWGAFVGLYDHLTRTRGVSGRRLPRSFWRRSALIATAGALAGATLMWRTIVGR